MPPPPPVLAAARSEAAAGGAVRRRGAGLRAGPGPRRLGPDGERRAAGAHTRWAHAGQGPGGGRRARTGLTAPDSRVGVPGRRVRGARARSRPAPPARPPAALRPRAAAAPAPPEAPGRRRVDREGSRPPARRRFSGNFAGAERAAIGLGNGPGAWASARRPGRGGWPPRSVTGIGFWRPRSPLH